MTFEAVRQTTTLVFEITRSDFFWNLHVDHLNYETTVILYLGHCCSKATWSTTFLATSFVHPISHMQSSVAVPLWHLYTDADCWAAIRTQYCRVAEGPLAGLAQGGNTCFLSAALQLLFHSPQFSKWATTSVCCCSQDTCPSCMLSGTYKAIVESGKAHFSILTPTRKFKQNSHLFFGSLLWLA